MADDKPKIKPDPDVEAEAQKLGNYQMHPLISKITHRFGIFNLTRNKANKDYVDIEKIGEDQGS